MAVIVQSHFEKLYIKKQFQNERAKNIEKRHFKYKLLQPNLSILIKPTTIQDFRYVYISIFLFGKIFRRAICIMFKMKLLESPYCASNGISIDDTDHFVFASRQNQRASNLLTEEM